MIFIWVLLNIAHLTTTKMFPIDQKSSQEEKEIFLKPPLNGQFFGKLTIAKDNWKLIEAESYMEEKCLPKAATIETIGDPVYRWFGANSQRDEVDYDKVKPFQDGTVEIKDLKAEDSGTYYCEVSSRSKSESIFTFEHTFVVFMNPLYSLERNYYLKSDKCQGKFEALSHLAEMSFCKSNDKCLFSFREDSCEQQNKKKEFTIKFVVTQKWKERKLRSNCGIVCKKEEISNDLFTSSEKEEHDFETKLKKTLKKIDQNLVYSEKSSEKYLFMLCPPGYDLYNEYACVPCDVGTSRSKKEDHCADCGIFSYQDFIAQKSCKTCGFFKTTSTYGAVSDDQCVYFFLSWIFLTVFLLCFFLFAIVFLWFFKFSLLVIVPMIYRMCECFGIKRSSDRTNKKTTYKTFSEEKLKNEEK